VIRARAKLLDLIVIDGVARGIVTRDLVTGKIAAHTADVVVLCSGGLRQCLLPVYERQGLQHHGHLALASSRRALRESVLHADPPDVHPAERRLSVEAHPHE